MAKKKPVKKAARTKAVPRKVAHKKPAAKKEKVAEASAVTRKIAQTPEERIAEVDQELVRLLNERTSLFLEKTAKSETPSRAMFDLSDDAALWQRVEKANKGPLNSNELKSVFRTVLSASRQRIRRTRVSYLGPAYTFTHLAAIHQFGESADLVPVSTIATVFDEVNRGHVDFGVVPIENSTDGRVVDTLDMFTRLPLRICGEVQLHVHQNLLARCERSEINEIYSNVASGWLGTCLMRG
jgi:chorismate mutase/prephenate dehydratase